jgi:hypothetical protein
MGAELGYIELSTHPKNQDELLGFPLIFSNDW